MPVRLHHIVLDAHDLPGLARFWTQALGWKILSEREIVIGTDENAPVGMCFMPVTDPKTVKNHVHLDLTSSAQDRDQEIERLMAPQACRGVVWAGAARWGHPDDSLSDPRRVGRALAADPSSLERTSVRIPAAYGGEPPLAEGGDPVPDDEELSPEAFDEVYAQISGAAQTNELFDQVLGPFPPGVEPFSLVPRKGLDRVLAELRLGPEDHLVDLCCGRGGIGLWFASVSGARLTGVDFSPGAITEGSRRVELFAPRPRASFVVADATDTSLPAGAADALVCIDALQLVPDPGGLLREMARVLRPGGRAVITTWERSTAEPANLPSSFSIADAGALAEAAGLHVLVREERNDWLEQQQAFYQRVITADGDTAEPELRLLAEEGRAMLPYLALARRLLLVASA